jgi:hypothetical protein
MTVTSTSPPFSLWAASFAAISPPIAPAPNTQSFMLDRLAETEDVALVVAEPELPPAPGRVVHRPEQGDALGLDRGRECPRIRRVR